MEDILKKAEGFQKTSALMSRAHYIAWERATKRQGWIGIPIVVITAMVGSSIFATINSNPAIGWKISAGLISLLAAVLSALQTSFKYSEIADGHKSAGASYAAMRRRLDLFILQYSTEGAERKAALSELDRVVKELNELSKKTPSIPDELYYAAVKQLQSEQDETRKLVILNQQEPTFKN